MADEDTNKKESEESKVTEVTEEVAEVKESPAAKAMEDKEVKPAGASEASAKEQKKPVSKDLEAISASLSNPTLSSIIEKIEKLSVLELADLVHALEDRFGVTATAPMAAAPVGAAQAGDGTPAEEQTTFNVILSSGGANKIAVIKAVRELVPTLGLKEAKDLVEAAPKPVLEGVNKERANEAKTKLTAAGATVELQ